jgi:hypothetical protein
MTGDARRGKEVDRYSIQRGHLSTKRRRVASLFRPVKTANLPQSPTVPNVFVSHVKTAAFA